MTKKKQPSCHWMHNYITYFLVLGIKIKWTSTKIIFYYVNLGLPMTHMTSAVWTSSNGSQCSKTFMRNSTITILTAKREWSAKSWKNPNTTETWPSNSNLDSSKLPLCIFTSFFSYYVFMFFKYASFWRVFFSKLCFNDFLNKQRYQLAHFQCRLFFYKYAKYLPFIFHEFLKFFFFYFKSATSWQFY